MADTKQTNKTPGPSSGAQIKSDVGPKIEPVNNTKLLNAAANRVFQDTGISLPNKSPEKVNTKTTMFGGSADISKVPEFASLGGSVIDIGAQFIDRDVTKNPTGFDTQQQVGDMLIKSGNPYAALAGLAYKGLSAAAEATGGNINTITKDQANAVGVNK